MTFYSIIFGLLFVGAARELLRNLVIVLQLDRELVAAFSGDPWADLFRAATLAMFIFSDTVYTSHAVEDRGLEYTVGMKLMDTFNFVLLSVAVVLLNPTETNAFDVSAGQRPAWWATVFWLLLAVYFAMLSVWNWAAGIFRAMPSTARGKYLPPALMTGSLLLLAAMSVRWPVGPLASVPAAMMLAATIAYLIWYQRRILDNLPKR